MLDTGWSPWPNYTEEEADAVRRVLFSNRVNYWTGTECREFEREFAEWCGTAYAIAVANGTVALDLALKAIEVGPGDEVIVTPRTFIASASSIVNAGGRPVFADVDRNSQNITAETIEAVLTPSTKAIVCVHLAGWPCDMDPIMELANEHGLYVIEDCAQAHGAKYKGRSVGSIGHIGAWSFCQDKIMTTGGEGGMVTTSDAELWRRMWSYKDHGKSWEAVYERQHPPGFRWVHESFGTNWRMTEMQAAIGRIQLRRLSEWVRKRQRNAALLSRAAESASAVRVPTVPTYLEHAFYKYYVFLRPDHLRNGWTRQDVIDALAERGVPAFEGSCSEVYLEAAFRTSEYRRTDRLTVAKELGETSLMFLVHPTLTADEMLRMATAVQEVLDMASSEEGRHLSVR